MLPSGGMQIPGQSRTLRCYCQRSVAAACRSARIRIFTTFPSRACSSRWSQRRTRPAAAWSIRARRRAACRCRHHARATRKGSRSAQGQDDFAGLRKYQPGDSLRHVAWKAVARGQAVMTKQFSGLAAGELWLDWDSLPLRPARRGTPVAPHPLGARSHARRGTPLGFDFPRS